MQPHANIDGRISLNDWFWFRNNFFHACVAKHTVGVHFKPPYKYRLSHLDSDKYDKIEKEKFMYVYMYMYMCTYMHMCMRMKMYVNVYVYAYAYVYVYVFMYTLHAVASGWFELTWTSRGGAARPPSYTAHRTMPYFCLRDVKAPVNDPWFDAPCKG